MSNLAEHGTTYPVQAADHAPQTNVPLASEKEKDEEPLPRSIRALKDANKADNHTRTVVICLDGTGDQFDNDNSNVVHFVSCLRKHDPSKQVTYYQSGIGTYDAGGLRNGVGAAVDMAVGSGLGIHVKDAYRFLMQNYRDGDKICLLGFSRGAYTVRCLAGMLHKVGLLPASNGAQVNFAYNFYKDDSREGWKMSADFKKTFCTNVSVYFCGVWDCVASVGFVPRKLPFSKTPTNSIHYFRHAMALDEHRAKFKVCHWQHQNAAVQRQNTIDNTPKGVMEREIKRSGIFNCFSKSSKDRPTTDGPPTDDPLTDRPTTASTNTSVDQAAMETAFEKLDVTRPTESPLRTDALEVWFMGAHADCGGGAVANETRHMLSRIPLRWMIRQCFECDTGILFSVGGLAEQGLDVRSLWPKYTPPSIPIVGPAPDLVSKYEAEGFPPIQRRSTALGVDDWEKREVATNGLDAHDLLPEQVEDHFDSMARVNDQLTDAKGWWVLEFWPVKVRVQMKNSDRWEKKVRFNMGRYRAIRHPEPNMHWTVKQRMDERRYTLRGRVGRNANWNVVA